MGSHLAPPAALPLAPLGRPHGPSGSMLRCGRRFAPTAPGAPKELLSDLLIERRAHVRQGRIRGVRDLLATRDCEPTLRRRLANDSEPVFPPLPPHVRERFEETLV